jgi:hypothetical protein
MPMLKAGELMMHYDLYGEGPPLVLLHGLGYQRSLCPPYHLECLLCPRLGAWINTPHVNVCPMPMPQAECAVVDLRTLRHYCLNPMHDEGQHKARLFATAFGMTADDAEDWRTLLRRSA